MAFPNMNFSKLSVNITIIRSLRYFINKEISVKFSTSQILASEKTAPVKYSTNKAAHVPISQVIGLEGEKSSRLWYERYVVLGSVGVFLVYFCIFRKENDIDEMLKGNPDFVDPKVKLVQLKTQLQYCKSNKLPTTALKAKIEELEVELKKYKSPFRK